MAKACRASAAGVLGVLVLVVSSALEATGRNLPEPITDATSFEELFEPVRTVTVDLRGERIGLIEKLYVSRTGRMLVIDVRFALAFLLDPDGRKIARLTVEASLPGYRWQPILGTFGPRGEILIWSGHPELLLFGADGTFRRTISPKMKIVSWKQVVVDDRGNIVGYCLLPQGPALVRMDSSGRPLGNPVLVGGEYKHLIGRFEEGGGLVRSADGFLYRADLCCPEIWRHKADLTVDAVFGRTPRFFKKLNPRADGVFADPRQFPRIQKLMRGVTQTVDFFCLNDTLLLAQYLLSGHSPPFALQIVSTGGRYYPSDRLRYRYPIRACAAGLAYVPQPVQQRKPGEFHYTIRVYRLRFR